MITDPPGAHQFPSALHAAATTTAAACAVVFTTIPATYVKCQRRPQSVAVVPSGATPSRDTSAGVHDAASCEK